MRPRGFTAVELAVCLALTAGLLAAVSDLLVILARRGAQISRKAVTDTWPDRVARLLQQDLERAKSWEFTPTRIVLKGFSGSDPSNPRSFQAPNTVTYRVQTAASKSWLIRSEVEQNSIDNRPPTTDLIASQIDRFQIMLPGAKQPLESMSGPLPAGFELRLLFHNQVAPLVLQYVK